MDFIENNIAMIILAVYIIVLVSIRRKGKMF